MICLIIGKYVAIYLSLGVGLVVIGALLRIYSSAFLSKDQVLATDGPYGFCRNPLYLGTIIIQAGFGFMSGSLIVTIIGVIFFLFLYFKVIEEEEKWLLSNFGEKYLEFLRKSPRLFPTFKSFSAVFRTKGFSTATLATNKELKNSLAVVIGTALFLIKYLFELWEFPINLW